MLPGVAERVALESGRPVLIIPISWVPGAYRRNAAERQPKANVTARRSARQSEPTMALRRIL